MYTENEVKQFIDHCSETYNITEDEVKKLVSMIKFDNNKYEIEILDVLNNFFGIYSELHCYDTLYAYDSYADAYDEISWVGAECLNNKILDDVTDDFIEGVNNCEDMDEITDYLEEFFGDFDIGASDADWYDRDGGGAVYPRD